MNVTHLCRSWAKYLWAHYIILFDSIINSECLIHWNASVSVAVFWTVLWGYEVRVWGQGMMRWWYEVMVWGEGMRWGHEVTTWGYETDRDYELRLPQTSGHCPLLAVCTNTAALAKTVASMCTHKHTAKWCVSMCLGTTMATHKWDCCHKGT